MDRGRISQAALRQLNNLFSDKGGYRVAALRQSKCATGFDHAAPIALTSSGSNACPLRKGVIGTNYSLIGIMTLAEAFT